jgi:hypothetical protein
VALSIHNMDNSPILRSLILNNIKCLSSSSSNNSKVSLQITRQTYTTKEVETASKALDSHPSSSSNLHIKLHLNLLEEMQPLFSLSISSKMLFMETELEMLHRVMPLEVSLNNNSSQTDKLALKQATLSMVEVLALSSIEIS